jgi:hypothetical protein
MMPSNDAGQVTVHLKDTEQYNAMVRLIDRIEKLAESAAHPYSNGGEIFYDEVIGVSPFRRIIAIHKLITEAKAGNWPKEEA